MKEDHVFAKVFAAVLLTAAAVCALVAYWEKIVDICYSIADRIEEYGADRMEDAADSKDFDDQDLPPA